MSSADQGSPPTPTAEGWSPLADRIAGQARDFLDGVAALAHGEGRRRDGSAAAPGGLTDPAGGGAAGREQGRHPARQLGARCGRRPGPGLAALGLARRLADYDEYAELFDPYSDTGLTAFRLSDDLAAVAADLIHGLQHYEAGRSLEALWWWQYSYVNHWGTHGSAALRALHAVLAHAMLDVVRGAHARLTRGLRPVPAARPRWTLVPAARDNPGRESPAGVGNSSRQQPEREERPTCGACRAEVRWLLGRRRRRHQAGGTAHRRDPEGRPFRGGGGLGHGRHHRRTARPGRPGQPAAAGPRTRHAADRGRADLDGAARHGDRQPRPRGAFVHRLPGRGDHRLRPRQGPDHRRDPGPDRRRAGRGRDPDRGRLPGRVAEQQGHHHAGPGRLRHHGGRAGRRAGADLRDLHRRGRGVHRRPGIVRTARRIPRISYEEMLEMAACGAKVLQLRCVEYARRYDMPIHVRSSFSNRRAPGSARADEETEGPGWSRRSSRGRARPERGEITVAAVRQGGRGGADLPHRPRPTSTST